MTETPLTVQDILDDAEESKYHTLLEIWSKVIEPAEKERTEQIRPQWANRICNTYREINFRDMPAFRKLYFDRVQELGKIVDLEIESDDECLNMTSPEEDIEHNAHHYINILINWQTTFLTWELQWDTQSEDAGVDIATIAELHRMFLAQEGLVSLLDQIKFELTDNVRETIATALSDFEKSWEG